MKKFTGRFPVQGTARWIHLSDAHRFVHDTHSSCPDLVNWALQQLLNFLNRHIGKLHGQRKQLPHSHPDELISFAVLTFFRFEVAIEHLDAKLKKHYMEMKQVFSPSRR